MTEEGAVRARHLTSEAINFCVMLDVYTPRVLARLALLRRRFVCQLVMVFLSSLPLCYFPSFTTLRISWKVYFTSRSFFCAYSLFIGFYNKILITYVVHSSLWAQYQKHFKNIHFNYNGLLSIDNIFYELFWI